MAPCPACKKLPTGSSCEPCLRKQEAEAAASGGVADGLAMAEDLEEAVGTPTNRARARSPLVGSASSSMTRHPKAHRVEISTPLQSIPLFPAIITEGDKGNKGKGGIKDRTHGTKGKGNAHGVRGKTLCPPPPPPPPTL